MRDVYLLKCYGKISHRKVGGVPNVIPLYRESDERMETPFRSTKWKVVICWFESNS